MTEGSAERLVSMANQIARFFESQRGDAAAQTADHLKSFWDPRMRAALDRHLKSGGAGLSPIASAAAARLSASPSDGGAAP
jgi:formate dehydrogenase subunit delta